MCHEYITWQHSNSSCIYEHQQPVARFHIPSLLSLPPPLKASRQLIKLRHATAIKELHLITIHLLSPATLPLPATAGRRRLLQSVRR